MFTGSLVRYLDAVCDGSGNAVLNTLHRTFLEGMLIGVSLSRVVLACACCPGGGGGGCTCCCVNLDGGGTACCGGLAENVGVLNPGVTCQTYGGPCVADGDCANICPGPSSRGKGCNNSDYSAGESPCFQDLDCSNVTCTCSLTLGCIAHGFRLWVSENICATPPSGGC